MTLLSRLGIVSGDGIAILKLFFVTSGIQEMNKYTNIIKSQGSHCGEWRYQWRTGECMEESCGAGLELLLVIETHDIYSWCISSYFMVYM